MDLREAIQERIAKLDETVLPDVMRELDFLEERHNRAFSQDFIAMMNRTPDPDQGMSGEEALKLATEEMKAHRQSRR